MRKIMSQLFYLDALEAEAIYIIREVAAGVKTSNALFHEKKDEFSNASSCQQTFYPGESRHSILHNEHDMEIQGK